MLLLIGITAVAAAGFAYYNYRPNAGRVNKFFQWMRDPASHPDWKLVAGSRCGAAPFLFPTDGFAGFLWGDPFGFRKTHQGIDVFAGTDVGITPVVAAYPGYLTRLPEWKSAVIVRVPDDPLQPGRQIWLYYTHMADAAGNSFISEEFPPGTSEKLIGAGAFLGYQGNYSGDPDNPVGVHLHFSIVEDDGTGEFKNELDIDNTLDPSSYLGLPLNGYENGDRVPLCEAAVE
jgi:murein DD-endopeptidase MepM/ murein hydrolase activator NlpD